MNDEPFLGAQTVFVEPTFVRFRFAPGETVGTALAFAFQHPRPCAALGEVIAQSSEQATPPMAPEEGLEILFIPFSGKATGPAKDPASPWLAAADGDTISVKVAETSVQWRPGRAVVTAPARLAFPAFQTVVDFAYHVAALRTVEDAILGNWSAVEADAPLTYAVSDKEFRAASRLGDRMRDIISLRLQFARIEPRVLCPDPGLPATFYTLGEELREALHCDSRAEAVDGQIESQEYVYELASQRLGDHHHARKGYLIEIAIVVLLAAELVLGAFYAVRKTQPPATRPSSASISLQQPNRSFLEST